MEEGCIKGSICGLETCKRDVFYTEEGGMGQKGILTCGKTHEIINRLNKAFGNEKLEDIIADI